VKKRQEYRRGHPDRGVIVRPAILRRGVFCCLHRFFTTENAEGADERRIYRKRMGSGNGWDLETDGIGKRMGSGNEWDRETDGIGKRTGSGNGRDRETDGIGKRTG
jgi:hypothetical protein